MFTSYQFANSVATLITIRDEEKDNLEAVLHINALLDYLCNGVDSEDEVEFCLAHIRGIEECTSLQNITSYGIDDVVCPWEHELLEIEEEILDAKREITGEEKVQPAPFFAGSFGPALSDDELPW